MKKKIKDLDEHLDKLINNADGKKYEGTSFKKDLGKKFGVVPNSRRATLVYKPLNI